MNFLKNLQLKYIIIFAFFFAVIYFFLTTSFFNGWKNAAYYDQISDLSTVVILIILFGYSFKIKKASAGWLIAIGSFLVIFDKLVQIILEEYILAYGALSSFYWIPGAVVSFIGLLIIFLGFKKMI